ncbi:hypothetical protein TNCV_5077281 [Trichonephila clavipes]|uniref:Uncharacterized protein n=1 Tax=Trichonephila clavipes TaxID=2585209 RepID=A0A8X6RW21_TRICX|nr:hypothetical protein TNCV_5077281 [Trichonephila clavipes]
MMLKAKANKTGVKILALSRDEFHGPRSHIVRQVALVTTATENIVKPSMEDSFQDGDGVHLDNNVIPHCTPKLYRLGLTITTEYFIIRNDHQKVQILVCSKICGKAFKSKAFKRVE